MATAALIAVLFLGTLMPGAWKAAATPALALPINLAALAHVALFAGICFVLPAARWWTATLWHVLLFGLVLALLTEGLQFFAVDRHPELAGVFQDMCGALLGWALGRRFTAVGATARAARDPHRRGGPANAATIRAPESPPSGR